MHPPEDSTRAQFKRLAGQGSHIVTEMASAVFGLALMLKGAVMFSDGARPYFDGYGDKVVGEAAQGVGKMLASRPLLLNESRALDLLGDDLATSAGGFGLAGLGGVIVAAAGTAFASRTRRREETEPEEPQTTSLFQPPRL